MPLLVLSSFLEIIFFRALVFSLENGSKRKDSNGNTYSIMIKSNLILPFRFDGILKRKESRLIAISRGVMASFSPSINTSANFSSVLNWPFVKNCGLSGCLVCVFAPMTCLHVNLYSEPICLRTRCIYGIIFLSHRKLR